jgi:serine/threonine protein kinase
MAGYQLDPEPIATGGQGAVHFGTAPDGRLVAVKLASPGPLAASTLQKEIELVRHMNSAGVAGVVPCLAALTVSDRPAMVMPRYPGHLGTWLKAAILQPNADTLPDILRIHARLARILGAVHKVWYENGTVVHRDVKPENIFLDAAGEPFLGDFGGAMAIEELRAVELAMFGTPMWAPLDQLLPGRAMPDTTWDTYATCVLLYAAITGARPAYQADPRELLTPAGQALWQAAKAAVEAKGDARQDAQRRFAVMRKGTRAEDLVDLTGRAALVAGDREAITNGVRRLGGLAGLDEKALRAAERGLWNLLVRGLSPLSHPSPPNRYRDADELAEAIEDVASAARPASRRTPAPAAPRRAGLQELLGADPNGTRTGPALTIGGADTEPPARARAEARRRSTLSAGPPILMLLGGVGVTLGGAVGLWFAWPTLIEAFRANRPLTEVVDVPAGNVQLTQGAAAVPAFRIDTTEVKTGQWLACAAAGACPELDMAAGPDHPASGLGISDAEALCAFRGGRVPSEAQWRVAHGPDPFPWGTGAATCDKAVAAGCGGQPGPVGSGRQGASPVGALDMAGNVWEWAHAVDGPVLLGGGATSSTSELGARGRKVPAPGERPALAGVRCSYPAQGGPRPAGG